jgi:hypothetical protein
MKHAKITKVVCWKFWVYSFFLWFCYFGTWDLVYMLYNVCGLMHFLRRMPKPKHYLWFSEKIGDLVVGWWLAC